MIEKVIASAVEWLSKQAWSVVLVFFLLYGGWRILQDSHSQADKQEANHKETVEVITNNHAVLAKEQRADYLESLQTTHEDFKSSLKDVTAVVEKLGDKIEAKK
jgi:hypothetical protein